MSSLCNNAKKYMYSGGKQWEKGPTRQSEDQEQDMSTELSFPQSLDKFIHHLMLDLPLEYIVNQISPLYLFH